MTLGFPEEFRWLGYIIGMEWPEGDEDAMRRIGEAWQTAAESLEDVTPDLDAAARTVQSGLEGATSESLDKLFAELLTGDYSMDKLAEAARNAGKMSDSSATNIEYTKISFYASLALLAAQIAWAVASAFWSFGTSLASIPVFQAVARTAVGLGLRRLITSISENVAGKIALEIAKGVAVNVVLGAGQDAAIQLGQMAAGTRDGFDWNQFGKTTATSAVGGLAGGVAGAGLGAVTESGARAISRSLANEAPSLGRSGAAVTNWAKNTIDGAGSGVAQAAASSGLGVAFGDPFSGMSLIGGAAGGGLGGATKDLGSLGGPSRPDGSSPPPDGTGSGTDPGTTPDANGAGASDPSSTGAGDPGAGSRPSDPATSTNSTAPQSDTGASASTSPEGSRTGPDAAPQDTAAPPAETNSGATDGGGTRDGGAGTPGPDDSVGATAPTAAPPSGAHHGDPGSDTSGMPVGHDVTDGAPPSDTQSDSGATGPDSATGDRPADPGATIDHGDQPSPSDSSNPPDSGPTPSETANPAAEPDPSPQTHPTSDTSGPPADSTPEAGPTPSDTASPTHQPDTTQPSSGTSAPRADSTPDAGPTPHDTATPPHQPDTTHPTSGPSVPHHDESGGPTTGRDTSDTDSSPNNSSRGDTAPAAGTPTTGGAASTGAGHHGGGSDSPRSTGPRTVGDAPSTNGRHAAESAPASRPAADPVRSTPEPTGARPSAPASRPEPAGAGAAASARPTGVGEGAAPSRTVPATHTSSNTAAPHGSSGGTTLAEHSPAAGLVGGYGFVDLPSRPASGLDGSGPIGSRPSRTGGEPPRSGPADRLNQVASHLRPDSARPDSSTTPHNDSPASDHGSPGRDGDGDSPVTHDLQTQLGLPAYPHESLTSLEARNYYLRGEKNLGALGERLRQEGVPAPERARRLFDLRNELRESARALMDNQDEANGLRSDERNMTWDEVVTKYEGRGHTGDELYDQISAAATRSRETVNEGLGIDPNNLPPLKPHDASTPAQRGPPDDSATTGADRSRAEVDDAGGTGPREDSPEVQQQGSNADPAVGRRPDSSDEAADRSPRVRGPDDPSASHAPREETDGASTDRRPADVPDDVSDAGSADSFGHSDHGAETDVAPGPRPVVDVGPDAGHETLLGASDQINENNHANNMCADVAIAAHNLIHDGWTDVPAELGPGSLGRDVGELTHALGVDHLDSVDASGVERALSELGDGSSGVVVVRFSDQEVAHAVNVFRERGVSYHWDATAGTMRPLAEGGLGREVTQSAAVFHDPSGQPATVRAPLTDGHSSTGTGRDSRPVGAGDTVGAKRTREPSDHDTDPRSQREPDEQPPAKRSRGDDHPPESQPPTHVDESGVPLAEREGFAGDQLSRAADQVRKHVDSGSADTLNGEVQRLQESGRVSEAGHVSENDFVRSVHHDGIDNPVLPEHFEHTATAEITRDEFAARTGLSTHPPRLQTEQTHVFEPNTRYRVPGEGSFFTDENGKVRAIAYVPAAGHRNILLQHRWSDVSVITDRAFFHRDSSGALSVYDPGAHIVPAGDRLRDGGAQKATVAATLPDDVLDALNADRPDGTAPITRENFNAGHMIRDQLGSPSEPFTYSMEYSNINQSPSAKLGRDGFGYTVEDVVSRTLKKLGVEGDLAEAIWLRREVFSAPGQVVPDGYIVEVSTDGGRTVHKFEFDNTRGST